MKLDMESFDYVSQLPEVDKVDVILLGGVQESKLQSGFYETRIEDYNILGQKTTEGKEAEEIARIWRYLPQNPRYQALCHSPLYALRFWKNNKEICNVTICWHCSNFGLNVPGDWIPNGQEYGFDSSSRAAQALLAKLKQIVPPPDNPAKTGK